jgi:hypothetical protein
VKPVRYGIIKSSSEVEIDHDIGKLRIACSHKSPHPCRTDGATYAEAKVRRVTPLISEELIFNHGAFSQSEVMEYLRNAVSAKQFDT